MSDLQIGLAVIGALAVLGVVLYNRWQERSVRREAQRAFGSGHDDVLLGDGRREPALEPPRRAPLQPGARPADGVDYVIELTLPLPKPAAEIAAAWSAIQHRFAGRALLDAGEEASVSCARAALQLVSRNGVVGDAELIEFRSMVETLAAPLGAAVRAPDMRQALEAARQLDKVCADADIQVALHVVGIGTAPAPFGEISGDQAFQVAAREDGVTLTLDVARTAQPARRYEAMARAGQELARLRGGRVVDDEGRELDERSFAAIGRQLDVVSQRLVASGIEPGSALALRVFS
jgi:hypothetical protein